MKYLHETIITIPNIETETLNSLHWGTLDPKGMFLFGWSQDSDQSRRARAVGELLRHTCDFPDPWADPKSRSTLGFCNLHHRAIRIQNWGFYFLDPLRGLGLG